MNIPGVTNDRSTGQLARVLSQPTTQQLGSQALRYAIAVSYVAAMAILQGMISQGMTSCGIDRVKSEKNAKVLSPSWGPVPVLSGNQASNASFFTSHLIWQAVVTRL